MHEKDEQTKINNLPDLLFSLNTAVEDAKKCEGNGGKCEYSCGTTETPSSTLKCSPGQTTCCVPDNCSTHDGYVLANDYTDEKTKCGQDTTDIIKTADANGTNGKICCKSIEVAREAVKEPSELGRLNSMFWKIPLVGTKW